MTTGDSAIDTPRTKWVWLLLALTALVVFFAGLTMPLVGPDEPRYAQVAREMFERGDWVTPTLGGFNWFEKPALLYWLQIASFNIFGVSEFAARFGSALFGIGTVAALWTLGRHVEQPLTNNEPPTTNSFANWLGLMAASTLGIIVFAHGASFDIILTFPMTAALVSFFIFHLNGRVKWLVAFYFFIGLAILAKGLVGIVFPFAIVGLFYVLARRLPDKKFMFGLVWGTVLASAVAATWYVPMYIRHGWEFIDQFFVQHHFQRYTSNKYLHPQPFHFFFWVLPLMTIPWLPFFFNGLWNFGRGIFSQRNSAADDDRGRSDMLLFAIAWLAVPLAFFTFSGSKLPGYILPAVPAAIILSADSVFRYVKNSKRRQILLQGIAASTFALVLISIYVFAPAFAENDSVKGLFAVARERSLEDLPVMTMHRVSHNAEFYSTGLLLREPDGKQKRLLGPWEVVAEMRRMGTRRTLVLVPAEYLYHLTQSDFITTEILRSNEEWTLALVSDK